VTEPSHAVFLSYASQDAQAALRIAGALRAGGIEVWFDQSELRGGDVWDRQIQQQIHDCRLFIPVVSANSERRDEGYFRREWGLAVDRTRDMAENKAFLVPVVIDDTPERGASVPEKFHHVQWSRLPAGQTPAAFVERVQRLLLPESSAAPRTGAPAPGLATVAGSRPPTSWRPKRALPVAVAVVVAAAAGYVAVERLWTSKRAAAQPAVTANAAAAEFSAPPHSIAVLPFVNMSGDKEQEYFSDGLTEEMINLLGQVPDVRVPARTSSFYFKGRNETIGNIARMLKVRLVLEGSVRKAGKRLRITAQLIRADNGYHVWSHTYDREDTDIFAVQDDIAAAVVSALQVSLGGPVPDTGSRGTRNTEAYNEYLRGTQLDQRDSLEMLRRAVDAYHRAIELDPNYAAAYAGLAAAEATLGDLTGGTQGIERAVKDADKAIALAPADATGYTARSLLRTVWLWEWSAAQADIEKALALGGRTRAVLGRQARLLAVLGRLPEAIAAEKEATDLDPLSSSAWDNLGLYQMSRGDYADAGASLGRELEIEPGSVFGLTHLGMLRLLENKAQDALEAFRRIDQEGFRLAGVAMAQHTLGRTHESQQTLTELEARHAQEQAFQIAEVCAWLGEKDQAFDWLERAYRQRDGGVSLIKFEPTLRGLRDEPRFKALLRKLNLPE
jgi:TolB-like protein/Flp pilus assembly protein TadD